MEQRSNESEKLETEGSKNTFNDKFAAVQDKTEQKLRAETYGLVTLEDFQKKKEKLAQEEALKAQKERERR